MEQVVSFKWVRRGDTLHAGQLELEQTFCGLPLISEREGSGGKMTWCEKCRVRSHQRVLVVAP